MGVDCSIVWTLSLHVERINCEPRLLLLGIKFKQKPWI
ncbi:hypothetical protein RRG08_001525, partial [Elysia crispata]